MIAHCDDDEDDDGTMNPWTGFIIVEPCPNEDAARSSVVMRHARSVVVVVPVVLRRRTIVSE